MSADYDSSISGWMWKIPAIAISYFVGVMISGAVITAAGMQWPAIPETPSETTNLVLNLIGSILMAGCLTLLASGVRGAHNVRWLVLAAFSYVVFGLNNQIEAAIFTTLGGTGTMLVFFIAPCLIGAAVAVWLVRPGESRLPHETVVIGRLVSAWWWRIVVAWLAFPVIYIFFGMLVSPIVVPFYQEQSFGLTLPGWNTILPVVLLRSALALAVTLPILVLWSRSRRALVVTLAISFFAMMGLIGLATTTFFPPTLRVVHSIEILGDAVAYAWLLVRLFIPRERVESVEPVPVGVE